MSYPSKKTILECEMWNPLLMCRGLNPVELPQICEYDDPSGKIKEKIYSQYETFKTLFESAKKQTAQKNLVFGLEADFSDVNTGNGGFFSSGFVPSVLEIFGGIPHKDETIERKFKFYWPKDPISGKYMSYLGSINLGYWPKILHDYTSKQKEGWYNLVSFAGGYKTFDKYFRAGDYWLYLWVSHQNEFDSVLPDCHVRMIHQTGLWDKSCYYNDKNKEEEENRKIKDGEIEMVKYFINFQKENCVETNIRGPAKFFSNIRPRFYWDGFRKEGQYRPDKENGIFDWHQGDCQVYGEARSQQEPRRYIYGMHGDAHALTPIFSFSDSEHDMTHQFYVDAPFMDDISHKQYYCKLDSSCT